ncbi:MAG: hypothetical protein V3T90_00810 [Anaerolineae bacterium]
MRGIIAGRWQDARSRGQEAKHEGWAGAYMYYVWSGSCHKAETWEFLKFLSGPESVEIIAESGV